MKRVALWMTVACGAGPVEGDAAPIVDAGAFDAAIDASPSSTADVSLDAPMDTDIPTDSAELMDASADDAGGGCRPVRTRVVTLASSVALDCVPGNERRTVFRESIADAGRTLVRVNLLLEGAGSGGVHGWTSSVDVGDPGLAEIINFGAGEGVCPGERMTRRMLGYGELTASSHEVVVTMAQYRDTACENGTVVVAAGSSIEVYVEDDRQECVGKDIVVSSYFRSIWNAHGAGADMPIGMTTDFAEVLSATLTTNASSRLRVLSQLEMSPSSTVNTCGNRVQTGVAAITRDGAYLVTEELGYPQSGGQTHLLLSPELVLEAQPPGTYTFGIAAAVNQLQQVGAVVGATFSGDTVIAIVSERE